MQTHEFRSMLLKGGLPEDQIDSVISHFQTFGSVPKILTLNDYKVAKATYFIMDRRLPSKEVLSPKARYVISLGERMAEWNRKVVRLNS